jgi:hypothetical protein
VKLPRPGPRRSGAGPATLRSAREVGRYALSGDTAAEREDGIDLSVCPVQPARIAPDDTRERSMRLRC